MNKNPLRNWALAFLGIALGLAGATSGTWAQNNEPGLSGGNISAPSSAAGYGYGAQSLGEQALIEETQKLSGTEASNLGQSADVPSQATELKSILNEYFYQNPALGEGNCAAYVKVLDSERVLYSYRGRTPMIPASNLKVITTAAALDMLGPDFRFTTELWGPEVDGQGVINGDIYLRGNGDPTNTPPYQDSPIAMYEDFADKLIQAGVREIKGDIVADDSAFDREFFPQGWSDHYHLDGYSAPVAGLSLNGNLVEVRVTGEGASMFPPNTHFQLKYNANGAVDTAIQRQRGSNVITLCGPLSEVNREITVDNPPLFAANSFANILAQRGIRCSGKVRLIREIGEPAAVTTKHNYASVSSPTLQEIITETNQQSDNFLAEHLFKAVGAHLQGRGSAQSGEASIKRFMNFHSIDTTGLTMADGCGLSTLDRATPNQLVDTLVAMAHNRHAKQFYESLASNEHGTLRGRIPAADVHGKTGTLDHHSALSGYVTTNSGQTVVFSLIFNDLDSISVAVDIQNKVTTLLAQWDERL